MDLIAYPDLTAGPSHYRPFGPHFCGYSAASKRRQWIAPAGQASLLPIVDTEAIVCHLAPLSCRAKDPNGNSAGNALSAEGALNTSLGRQPQGFG
jgi:hypothetical protein